MSGRKWVTQFVCSVDFIKSGWLCEALMESARSDIHAGPSELLTIFIRPISEDLGFPDGYLLVSAIGIEK